MDMDTELSPLPHKAPYIPVQVQLQSPTPEETPSDESMLTSPLTSDPIFTDALYAPVLPLVEKKKSIPRRPSLTRMKGLSTGSIPQALHPESQLPPFKFGNYSAKPTSLSLEQIFESSPVQERTRPSPVLASARPRPPFGGLLSNSRNGSPNSQHLRKASNPVTRPRKLTRRSLSMYEHPEDVMKGEKDNEPSLPPIMDIEGHASIPRLPHFTTDQIGDLPRISKDTMIDILDGKYDGMYQKRVIIDCRFEYEYLGGHIDGAVNFNDRERLASQLLEVEPTSNALLIFHCEYSAHRAPLVAKFIRNRDRGVNADRYPALTYPEVYILDGGYSSFYKDHRARCFPQNYVEMEAKEHEMACERGMGKVKQQRTKLMRAQTFAFGQHSPQVDSSPTAMGRCRLDSDDMELGLNYTPAPGIRPTLDGLRRAGTLRQFSY
jgi:M-phase inducer tyrosine phosphatase